MSLTKKKYYLSKLSKKKLLGIATSEKLHFQERGIHITSSMKVGDIRTEMEKIHLTILNKYARKEKFILIGGKTKEKVTRSGNPIRNIFGKKFIIGKGKIRRYPKISNKQRQQRSEQMKKWHREGKFNSKTSVSCRTDPKCQKNHPSKEEADFCFQLNRFYPNQSGNWQFKISDEQGTIYVDYFLSNQVFLEYHPPNYRTDETAHSYTQLRRKKIDQKGQSGLSLVVIVALNHNGQTEQITDYAWIVYSMKELKILLADLIS